MMNQTLLGLAAMGAAAGLFAQTSITDAVSELPVSQLVGTGGLLAALAFALRWLLQAYKEQKEQADKREEELLRKIEEKEKEIKDLLKAQIKQPGSNGT